jgi:hypothetical protein
MTFYNNETNNDVYFSPSGLLNLSAYTFKNAPLAGIRIDVNRFDCDKFIFDSIVLFQLILIIVFLIIILCFIPIIRVLGCKII